MSNAIALANLVAGRTAGPDGHVRLAVDAETWTALAEGCAAGLQDLIALWADDGFVHLALGQTKPAVRAVVSLPTDAGRYPSVAARHPPALRLERAMRDLQRVHPIGLPDARPWLDHGRWPGRQSETRYEFLPTEGEGLHQIPVGPVHAGIIEPGHFRFTANGETVVRLEERLGYVHKGVEGLMAGAEIDRAARIVGRISGDSTVAPHQRHRRDLQRCQRAHHPCPLHPTARGGAGGGRCLLRPSPDDGLRGPGRRGD